MTREEAIKKIKKSWDFIGNNEKEVLETLIPELKESEGEKIRKALIKFHKSSINIDGIKGEDILAWLEKQGKSMWTEEDEAHLHSITTHLDQWIARHSGTYDAGIQWQNLGWIESLKQRML